MPLTSEEQQRAKWDLLLLDIEHRTEQIRQLKTYEPLRLVSGGLAAGAALFARPSPSPSCLSDALAIPRGPERGMD
jgi:hypothetical protein